MKFWFISKLLISFYFLTTFSLSGQWNIVVNAIPLQTPDMDDIYIAGSFNNWNPGQQNYKLTKNQDGHFSISLQVSPGTYQFKFTRGSWATVEGTSDGKVISNRSYHYSGSNQNLTLQINGWEDQSGPVSTASPQVSLLSEAFFMPQLNKHRKIWVYLPKDYLLSEKRYPVIYMHDGQNLFDRSTSFLDEWKVDESMDSLYQSGDYGCIIIGIENGGQSRINEYTPWPHPDYGGGDGEKYVRFITENLKPFVDANYRTLPEPKYTAIAGSSLGGLISHYAGIHFQNTFGRIGSLSPSLWFSSKIYTIVSEIGVREESRFYLSTGTEESSSQVFDVNRMADTLKKYGLKVDDLKLHIVQGGKHNELLWQKEFPLMYKWFWQGDNFTTAVNDQMKKYNLNIYRVADSLLTNGDNLSDYEYTVSNLSGQRLQSGTLTAAIPIPAEYRALQLIISVTLNGKLVYTKILP